MARLHLLEILELRAMDWIPNDRVDAYYKQKLAEVSLCLKRVCLPPVDDISSDTNIGATFNLSWTTICLVLSWGDDRSLFFVNFNAFRCIAR